MIPLPVNKLYIDSQFKTVDSISDSQFKIQLPISLDFPEHTKFVIDDINIPHTWTTIEQGINDRIYFEMYDVTNPTLNPPIPASELYIIVDPGNYTGPNLKTAINSQFANVFAPNNPGVTFSLATIMSCVYYYTNNTLSFHLLGGGTKKWKAKVLTDYELTQPGRSFYKQPVSSIPSMNDVFRNFGISKLFDELNDYYTGFLNLVLCSDVYLSSPNLGTFDTLTATGEQGVIKNIPITGDYGMLILDKVQSIYDQLECSRVTLTTLEFHLKDAKGRYIPLHGATISFTIIFMHDV
jgi:hypothetical protein